MSKYLTVNDLALLLKVSRNTVASYVRRGVLPPPQKLSTTTNRWDEAEVTEWLARQSGGKT